MSELNEPAANPLSLTKMIRAGVSHSWRVSGSVALGVATATAVIVGALLVGDSMRGSLRGLTVERLGKVEAAIVPGVFFDPQGIADNQQPVALIFFDRGVVEYQQDGSTSDETRRAGGVQVIGCDPDFWNLDVSGVTPQSMPDQDSVVLNQSAADELGVSIGDLVTVRLPSEQAVPADSPLGRSDIQSEGLPRMKVVDIVADRGLGRFSLSASQAAPQNIFISRQTIGEVLDRDGQANMLLFDRPISTADLNLDMADVGLTLKRVRREFGTNSDEPAQEIFDYYSITSDRLLLPEIAVEKLRTSLPVPPVESSTYLANAIERLDETGEVVATVPYSTITAVDSTEKLPLKYEFADVQDGAVPLVLNSWTAERLEASVGTELRVAYFEPEVENGKEIERYFSAVVTEIVPITKPSKPYFRTREAKFDRPPTIYNDPDLTPTVPGVTDQESISDWDLPFPLERKIANEDDQYWKDYRLTPKAFLPLAEGKRLFGSRFGDTTGLRIDAKQVGSQEELKSQIDQAILPSFADLGWAIQPLRQHQLDASQGTTPFDGLFLSLSFFVIMAAILLIAMLFRLGLVQRMKQFGTLLALGWTPKLIGKLALGEGLIIASIGVLLGLAGGVVYAKGVLWALRSWWVGAVTVPFLTFHWTPTSLLIGVIAGWLVAAATLAVTVRWLMRVDVQSLLSGRDVDQTAKRETQPSKLPVLALGTAALAIVIAGYGATVGGQTAAGGFVGGGMLLLVAALIAIYVRLKKPRRITDEQSLDTYTIGAMASRNASRHPLRSTMTIGLMATAAFLIIAISAFQLQPTQRGTGGFNLIGQSAQPLNRNLRDPQVQLEVIGPNANQLTQTTIAPMRLKLGQDASCNNLYRASRPTVLGVPTFFSSLFSSEEQSIGLEGFDWAASDSVDSPWELLDQQAKGTEEDPIPVIIDQNTAMWSLQMMKGLGETKTFEYESGNLTFRVVGLLANSVLQGRLLIGEKNFQTAFPDVSGYQFFMFASQPEAEAAVASLLENRLGDIGMDVSDASSVLSGMMAVQNTYLRTFQSLGGLGLLLGTIGLAVSQLRSVLERRQELAVMRAIGFTRKRLATIVMSETASLLLMGIGCGTVCAVLAVLPYAILNRMSPPIAEPLLIVMGIIAFGMFAGLLAVRRVTQMPLLESLRSE